jgi:hypothetical protein
LRNYHVVVVVCVVHWTWLLYLGAEGEETEAEQTPNTDDEEDL